MMFLHHNINPNILTLGPIHLRWYGLMYVIGFFISYLIAKYLVKKRRLEIEEKILDELYLYCVIGLLVGGRIGYIIFYHFSYYLTNPMEIFAVWQGGMSFHGGLLGVLVAGILFIHKKGVHFWRLADIIIITAPVGLGLGRIGNFINGELFGRITNVPWAMIFPDGGELPRHPSQLYEAFFEGPVLFIILWLAKDIRLLKGKMLALFLICYGVMRFIIEFFREPDPQVGLIMNFFSLGQILCAFMVFSGIFLLFISTSVCPLRQR